MKYLHVKILDVIKASTAKHIHQELLHFIEFLSLILTSRFVKFWPHLLGDMKKTLIQVVKCWVVIIVLEKSAWKTIPVVVHDTWKLQATTPIIQILAIKNIAVTPMKLSVWVMISLTNDLILLKSTSIFVNGAALLISRIRTVWHLNKKSLERLLMLQMILNLWLMKQTMRLSRTPKEFYQGGISAWITW